MNEKLFLTDIDPIERIKNVIKAFHNGNGALIVDDENRENEGDIIFPAETINIKQMALTIRHGSGIVCLCITEKRRQQLALPMMVEKNSSQFQTPFTVSIEAAEGVTTGVSANDRLITIHKAIADNAKPTDLNKPGHVFPLRAQEGGVMQRRGHTEATIDLVTLAGFKPVGILCELTNDDGTMARMPEVVTFAEKHNMPVATIKDLIIYHHKIIKK